MKAIGELFDDLFRRAKATAAGQGMSLKQQFSEAVDERLRRERR